jgi:hypothetical protein
MAHAPTINVSTDDAPAPRAEIVFATLPVGTAFLRAIHRLGDRGRDYRVRGSIYMPVVGSTARVDYEVPFGTAVTYRAEALNSALDSLGFTDASAPVTLDVAETYVHNPLDPTVQVKVGLRAESDHSWSRPVSGSTFYPTGRRVGVVVGGARSGIRDLNLELWVDTDEDATTFAALVGDYTTTTVPVLCFRLGSDVKMRLPRPYFGSVFDPREVDIDLSMGGQTTGFSIRTDEVSPPTQALVVPLLTRADLNAYYATRAALNADNLTRLAVNRRYDLAGTA